MSEHKFDKMSEHEFDKMLSDIIKLSPSLIKNSSDRYLAENRILGMIHELTDQCPGLNDNAILFDAIGSQNLKIVSHIFEKLSENVKSSLTLKDIFDHIPSL